MYYGVKGGGYLFFYFLNGLSYAVYYLFMGLLRKISLKIFSPFISLSILLLITNLTFIPHAFAGERTEPSTPALENSNRSHETRPEGDRGDFAKEFHSYQSAVRAGKSAFNKKDYTTAVANYSKAIERSPFEVDLYHDRGVAHYKSGKAQDAVEDFNKVLVMDSRRYSAYVYRGLCHEKSGNYISALKDYTSALGMNPKDAGIHNNLAWLYATAKDEKIQDKAKALEHAKKAAELSNERNAEILDTLARAYFFNGMHKEAVDAEEKAIKLEAGNEGFKENLKEYGKVLSTE